MRETRLFGSMSGNRKQSHAKPDCGNPGERRVMRHRKTNATAPVLDSTRLFVKILPRSTSLVITCDQAVLKALGPTALIETQTGWV